jgi:hypothetical protein
MQYYLFMSGGIVSCPTDIVQNVGLNEVLPKKETVIMRGLASRRDLHAAVSI